MATLMNLGTPSLALLRHDKPINGLNTIVIFYFFTTIDTAKELLKPWLPLCSHNI